MRGRWIVAGAVAMAGVMGALAWPRQSEATEPPSLEELAAMAVVEDTAISGRAIAALRTHGPAGHRALMNAHAEAIEALRDAPERNESTERLRHAIDVVSGQRDGHTSGLYWHTDLGAARDEARRTDRPILSLRLLGELDEELSCANSRLFRVLLYSDPEVAERLRETFVLHWSSERPAPRIEIDMGDGRRIVRTITGNSVHYVLDRDGLPVDAIVGLYAPEHFLAVLRQAERTHSLCASGANRAACLARRHGRALRTQRNEWTALSRGDETMPSLQTAIASLPGGAPLADAPPAEIAMPLTISKASFEMPMLRAMQRGVARIAPEPTQEEPDWATIARLRSRVPREGADDATRNLLRLKMGTDDIDATAERLMRDAAADGERNEVLHRRRIQQWFVDGAPELASFEAINARVYTELMLTPANDPWLGLRPEGTYDAIEVAVAE